MIPTTTMTISSVEELIHDAIGLLFTEDADLSIDTNERSITHRLAVHLERRLRELGIEASVDCEYNRNGTYPKKLVTLVGRLAKGVHAEDLVKDTRARTVFPDIVVHRRGADGPNLLVIELKREGASAEERERDRHKLRAYIEELGYQHAYLVLLGKNDMKAIERVPPLDQ